MGRKKVYSAEYSIIMKQKKQSFYKFVETYVPHSSWKKRLVSQLFPKGKKLQIINDNYISIDVIIYSGYGSSFPADGWMVAEEICKKYYHNEVLSLLQLSISTIHSNSVPIRVTRSYSTKLRNVLKMNLSNESNKTYLLISILSNEIRDYLNDMSFF